MRIIFFWTISVFLASLEKSIIDQFAILPGRGIVTPCMFHQFFVRNWTNGVMNIGASLPGQLRPIPPDLHPYLGAVIGFGQTPFKT